MQWHRRPGWGGYTWDAARYPDVPALLRALKDQGLALGMNLHDDDGVSSAEDASVWPAFAAAMGLNTSSGSAFFSIGNKTYADALATAVMAPLLAGPDGLDLCWTDWQQGVWRRGCWRVDACEGGLS